MKAFLMGVVALSGGSIAQAQEPATGAPCGNQSIDAVTQKYQPQYDQLQHDGDEIKHNASFSGKVTWKDQTFIFDTPTATMKTQNIVLGLPQVTMKVQHIIFDTPSTRMKRVKTGQYPEWHGPFKVEWKDIYIDVPEPFMQRQDIETAIPEFKWDNTSIKFDIPEFTMHRQKIILGLPQFTMTEVHLNDNKIHDESEALKDKADTLQKNQQLDIVTALHTTFSCQRTSLQAQKASALTLFDTNIQKINDTIADLQGKGVDVSHVTDGSGGTVDMRAIQADLVNKRSEAVKTFDDAAKKLDDAEQKAVSDLQNQQTV